MLMTRLSSSGDYICEFISSNCEKQLHFYFTYTCTYLHTHTDTFINYGFNKSNMEKVAKLLQLLLKIVKILRPWQLNPRHLLKWYWDEILHWFNRNIFVQKVLTGTILCP